jgi:hypothetical protein
VRLSHMLYFDDFLTVRCLALDHSMENLNDDLARDDRRQSVCEPAGPAQIVLVLQGGGALGAHQGGAYEALQRSGRNRRIYHYDQTQPHEPGDWCDLAVVVRACMLCGYWRLVWTMKITRRILISARRGFDAGGKQAMRIRCARSNDVHGRMIAIHWKA